MRPNAVLRGLLLAVPLFSAAPAPAEDLLQVYQQARQSDPVLAGAQALRAAREQDVALARAPLLPQASAAVALAHQPAAGAVPAARTQSAGVTFSQVVVDRARQQALQATQALDQAQQARLRAAEHSLLVRVAGAYFTVLGAEQALATAQANETAFGQQVQQADERLRQGLSAAVDVAQARAYHASARAALVTQRRLLADAREALAELTGGSPGALRPLRADLVPEHLQPALPGPPSPGIPAADAQAWVAHALAHNPLLQGQQAALDAAERRIGAARAAHYPTLSATLDSERQRQWPSDLAGTAGGDGRSITRVGLQLRIPLAAGGAVQARTHQARHEHEAEAAELERLRRRVVREVMQHHEGLQAGRLQTEATQAAVDAARQALASTRVGQSLGTQTMNELLQAIQTLSAAQNAHDAARHQFVLSRLLLQQAAGTLTEADLAAVNTLLQ
ncbi:TolC family outer membrane protein [Pseudorhodoferax sp.]|uniref:TolC family outer membrane protein n=1 Tax=Pseudorhodoferax sp. TaxID=1993553 RepID=UPI002DD62094|nr:TolC family outer membrane protein [Pseudorhodoferax sp.]